MVQEFAGILRSEVEKRYTRPQMQHILLLSYFDPFVQVDIPSWLLPKRGYVAVKEEIKKEIKTDVLKLYRGLK